MRDAEERDAAVATGMAGVESAVAAGPAEAEAGAEATEAVEAAEPMLDQAACERAEEEALAQVFADVRTQSARGHLVEPTRWEAAGIVPQHLSAEAFEMLVYDVLEQAHAAAPAPEAIEKPEFRSATSAVGVPRPIGAAPEGDAGPDAAPTENGSDADAETPAVSPDVEAGAADEADEAEGSRDAEQAEGLQDSGLGFKIPAGYGLVELEGELTLVPLDEYEAEESQLACDDIVALVGKHSYYLYSQDFMTDSYAHWAFLASEDDRVLTFVDCVREESRIYPRPMLASSLSNEPFCMTPEEIDETWKAISESGEYPDIGQVFASNGEAFFFSEDHISRAYAQSLAEWHAVERDMNR